jgi:hypothetical protein
VTLVASLIPEIAGACSSSLKTTRVVPSSAENCPGVRLGLRSFSVGKIRSSPPLAIWFSIGGAASCLGVTTNEMDLGALADDHRPAATRPESMVLFQLMQSQMIDQAAMARKPQCLSLQCDIARIFAWLLDRPGLQVNLDLVSAGIDVAGSVERAHVFVKRAINVSVNTPSRCHAGSRV